MWSDALLDVTPADTLDLHGFTRVEAERAVRALVATWRRRRPGAVVHVITGKGRGSARRPALRPAVRRLLVGPLAGEIADWARDVDEGGFLVKVR